MNKENIKIYNGFQNCSKGVNLDFKVGRVVEYRVICLKCSKMENMN